MSNNIVYVPGSSHKICQLTGEMDREFHKPTVNQTRTRFGLVAADLGYSFEHKGKRFFLFGDAAPSRTFNRKPNGQDEPPRTLDDNDAIAFTSDTSIDNCLRLDFIHYPGGAYKRCRGSTGCSRRAWCLGMACPRSSAKRDGTPVVAMHDG